MSGLHSLLACLAGMLLAIPAQAQLIPPATPVPRTTLPPVVFLNGYQFAGCPTTFADTFGIADHVLQANGEVSLFFSSCTLPAGASIEDLGAAFATFLSGLKYTDGKPVGQVDVVAHSMGGLVLRAYLSGKQNAAGLFQPPAATHIRKAVLLATPNFGTPIITSLPIQLTTQVEEMSSGSLFLFDLATWNDTDDDLAGVDAIAAAGNAGTGVLSGTGAFDDGVVPLTSASLRFYGPGRTRVLPYCHVAGGGLVSDFGLCPSDATGIANIDSASHLSAQLIVSFLHGTNDWQKVGTAAESDPFLSKDGGLIVAARAADDSDLTASSATAAAQKLNISSDGLASIDQLAAGKAQLNVAAGPSNLSASVTLPAGGTQAYTVKSGPLIARVFPAAAANFPLEVAPRMIVAIYGSNLAGGTVSVGGSPLTTFFVGASQINALLPESVSGLIELTLQSTTGKDSVNLLVGTAAPALFTQNTSGSGPVDALKGSNQSVVTAANPAHPGDVVELYGTGLGLTTLKNGLEEAVQQPTVTVEGLNCAVKFAGGAPGYPGLDQINCTIPEGATANAAAPLVVTSGNRVSNTTTLAIQ